MPAIFGVEHLRARVWVVLSATASKETALSYLLHLSARYWLSPPRSRTLTAAVSTSPLQRTRGNLSTHPGYSPPPARNLNHPSTANGSRSRQGRRNCTLRGRAQSSSAHSSILCEDGAAAARLHCGRRRKMPRLRTGAARSTARAGTCRESARQAMRANHRLVRAHAPFPLRASHERARLGGYTRRRVCDACIHARCALCAHVWARLRECACLHALASIVPGGTLRRLAPLQQRARRRPARRVAAAPASACS